jgi:hypothetical protein
MSVRRSLVRYVAAVVSIAGYFADRHVDKPWAESAIKSHLQRELRARTGDDSITVQTVKCTVRHERDTTCVAHVSDAAGTTLDIHIAGAWNPDTRTLPWHTADLGWPGGPHGAVRIARWACGPTATRRPRLPGSVPRARRRGTASPA